MRQATGHAALSTQSGQSLEMDVPRAERTPPDGGPSILGKEYRTIASQKAGRRTQKDKQSLDYAMRTGLAGGLAGCAVSTNETAPHCEITLLKTCRPRL